jgi:hypothetical protein
VLAGSFGQRRPRCTPRLAKLTKNSQNGANAYPRLLPQFYINQTHPNDLNPASPICGDL